MYKIGDKVETKKGNGIIVAFSGYEEQLYIVEIANIGYWGFNEYQLKSYRTASEKLIEMGLRLKVTKNYADGVFSHEWWNENDDLLIVFYIDEKVTTVYEGNNEIMNVIPQYLEEMV